MAGTEDKEQNMQESVKSYHQNTNMKVLVVDDDLRVREMIPGMLSRSGYECKTAANATEALDLLQKDTFSIVISDIRMPETDGIELLKEIKATYPDIDVISITGHSNDYTFMDVVNAGASDFILKPFSKDELEAKLTRIVRERELKYLIINSKNKFRTIVDGIKDDIYIVDSSCTILSANMTFAERVGMPVRDTIGKYCYELLHGQDAPCSGDPHPCPAQKAFSTGLPQTALRDHLQNTNTVYSEVSATPLIEDR